MYIPGCPPTPQALINGLITLQKKIDTESLKEVRWYKKEKNQDIPVPVLGPDLMDPRRYEEIKQYNARLAEEAAAAANPDQAPVENVA